MDFDQHINTIKQARNLDFSISILDLLMVKTEAYKTYVRPSTVWGLHDKNDIIRLEMEQRRSARFVTNRYRNRSNVGEMLETLDWKIDEGKQN